MRSVQEDIPWVNLAIAGTAQTGIANGNNDTDGLIELIDKYDIYSEMPYNWYRLDSEKTWLGHTINLCGTHALDLLADRSLGCENLTRLLQTIAASMLPFERTGCRHQIGDCLARPIETSCGPVCHHSLQIELVHSFITISSHRLEENECLEQLESRLLLSGVPQVKTPLTRRVA